MKTANLISISLVFLMLIVMYLISNEILSSCCCCWDFPTGGKQSQVKIKNQWPTDMLTGIKIFLRSHSQYGEPIYVQDIPDWASGRRQRVQFSNGRNLLFYLEEGDVTAIYENNPIRMKIWGNYGT